MADDTKKEAAAKVQAEGRSAKRAAPPETAATNTVVLDAPLGMTALSVGGRQFRIDDGKVEVPEALAEPAVAHIRSLVDAAKRAASRIEARTMAAARNARMSQEMRDLRDDLHKRGLL